MRFNPSPSWVAVVLLLFAYATLIAPAAPPAAPAVITPPPQPSAGPGGSQYTHDLVEEHCYGQGDLQYWLFEPAEPKPQAAPVVIFNHGFGAMTPHGYGAWINHIVRRGSIVIFPRYQASLKTKATSFSSNAIAASKDALQRLKTESGHVLPQLDKVAVVGHSMGGLVSAVMAARAAQDGLPPMKAVMCVEPGKTWGPAHVSMGDLSTMPASTLLLALVGDRDTVVRDIDGKRIINETVRIPAENKNFVKMISDNHGKPSLVANHFCPAAPGGGSDQDRAAQNSAGTQRVGPVRQLIRERMRQRLQQRGSASQRADDSGQATDTPSCDSKNMRGIDVLDYYCTWKLFDALEDAAIQGKNRDYALGNTPKQRYMGKWSDGVPVKELIIEIGRTN